MTIGAGEFEALWLTLRLATVTTLVLFVVGVPLAWKLCRWQSRWRHSVEILITLPLVLPPTVLGFYLLLLFSPNFALGGWIAETLGQPLVFSFAGLVVASVISSLPFMVQPLMASFSQNGSRLATAALSLGMPPVVAVLRVVLPASRTAIVSACALTFAHTMGEFGVVLMIGGAIPGETEVVSIALFQHVEVANYGAANRLALVLIIVTTGLLLLARWLGAAKSSSSTEARTLGVANT
ncbi:hypothetical protein Maes01_00210 [Microbulbifer aestuariivivens]|uniref:Molybdenum transport system permease n=1 Tax=Microbulbifer aestuariivivens TaxID=1908308 RepID=A0ABP9WNJ6_9GAMM